MEPCTRGLTAAVCSLARDFLAASGVQALAAVLDRPGVGPLELHMALVCLDSLTRAAGVAGCEAALGWWIPSGQALPDAAADATAAQQVGVRS